MKEKFYKATIRLYALNKLPNDSNNCVYCLRILICSDSRQCGICGDKATVHVNAKSAVNFSMMDVAKKVHQHKKKIHHSPQAFMMTVTFAQALNNLIMTWEVLQSSMTLNIAAMINTLMMKKYLPKLC